MIRILALSDIHNNIESVRLLRAQERNEYDVILVAGDMGSESAADVLKILSTFRCQVMYIYGNWDNLLDYDARFGQNCTHLHHHVIVLENFAFTGYSGCAASWGKNPASAEMQFELDSMYVPLGRVIDTIQQEIAEAREAARSEYKTAIDSLGESMRTQGRLMNKAQRKRLIVDAYARHKGPYKKLRQLRTSKEFKTYSFMKSKLLSLIEKRNTSQLVARVAEAGVDGKRLIVMSHDRTSRIHEQLPNIALHCFGHRHGFKHTHVAGIHYANVSVLDWIRSVVPQPSNNMVTIVNDDYAYFSPDAYREVQAGTYCVMDIGDQIHVESRSLFNEPGQWLYLDTLGVPVMVGDDYLPFRRSLR